MFSSLIDRISAFGKNINDQEYDDEEEEYYSDIIDSNSSSSGVDSDYDEDEDYRYNNKKSTISAAPASSSSSTQMYRRGGVGGGDITGNDSSSSSSRILLEQSIPPGGRYGAALGRGNVQGNLPMGCWINGDSQQISSRKQLDTLFSDAAGNSLLVGTAAEADIRVKDLRYDTGPNGSRGPGVAMTSRWQDYKPETYRTEPQFDSEYRRSSGVLVNTYTGKMYETFEEDLPPPNTDKSIPREQFTKSNRRLVAMQGGNDMNAPRIKKKEICQNILDESYGPNVWGDQLYANRRRQEIQTRATRDLWNNRNGIYSVEAYDDRQPVGYVGYVNTLRPRPYLPATQRAEIDNRGYTGIDNSENKSSVPWGVIDTHVSTTKPVFDEQDSRQQGPDASNTNIGDYVNVYGGEVNLRGTNRSFLGSEHRDGALDATYASPAGENVQKSAIDSLRDTLKAVMDEFSFGSGNAAAPGTGGNVIVDTDVKATQKGLMSGAFPVTSAVSDLTTAAGYTTIIDTDVKATQKGLMSGAFPVTSAVSDLTTAAGYTTIIDTDVKATQKGLMSGAFPVTSVVSDLTTAAGYTAIIDTNVKATQKGLMSGAFPVTSAISDLTTAAGYTTIIDTDVKSTQKGLMSNAFPVRSAQSTATGATIEEFQGDLISKKWDWYSGITHEGAVSNTSNSGGYIGTQLVGPDGSPALPQLDPTRGKTQVHWVNYSQVPESGGGTTNVNSARTFMIRPTERGGYDRTHSGQNPIVGGPMGDGSVYHHGMAGGAIVSSRMFREDSGLPTCSVSKQAADIDRFSSMDNRIPIIAGAVAPADRNYICREDLNPGGWDGPTERVNPLFPVTTEVLTQQN